MPEDITIATEEGRRLAEQLQDSRRHARKLLEVKNLSTHFFTADGVVHAVDDVSFELDYGETLGLVGESGCGKSVTALSLTRLIPNPPGRIVNGEIIFDGVNIMKLSSEERDLRGKRIGFIFQDPDDVPESDADRGLPDCRIGQDSHGPFPQAGRRRRGAAEQGWASRAPGTG